MMTKLMKKIAIAFTVAMITLTATTTAFAHDKMCESYEMENTYEVKTCAEDKAEENESMRRSNSIANLIDRAMECGLFTQNEIDDAVKTIVKLGKRSCARKEEVISRDHAISGIIDEMEQEMSNCGYLV